MKNIFSSTSHVAESMLELHKAPTERPPRHDLRKIRVIESDPDLSKDVGEDPDLKLSES